MTELILWKDKKSEKLDPTLFSQTAENLAKKIGKEGRQQKCNKNSQLRRYFDEIVRLNALAHQEGADMDQILPQVHMLIAKIVYARARDLVTDSFENMMKSAIQQIRDEKDLQVFSNFLESFMGFYKLYGPR